MANLLALSPVVVLLIGALALAFLRPNSFPRVRPFISVLAGLASLLLLQVAARQPDLSPYLFPAFASAPDLDLTFSFSAASVFFSSAVLIASLALISIKSSSGQPQNGTAELTVLAGALAFFLAANWTTLAAAWLLTDLGLVLWSLSGSLESRASGVGWRFLSLSQFGALVFIAAGVLALNGGSSLRFASASLAGLPGDLAVLAAWIRTGLYPFHLPLSGDSRTEHSDRLERAALPMLLGAYLLARILMMVQGQFADPSVLFSLALLGAGATALLVLGETEPGPNPFRSALVFGAPILLTPFITDSAARSAFVVWLGLGLFNFAFLTAGAGLLRANARRLPLRRILLGAGILAAAGFPITPAFFGRSGLYAAAIQSGEGILVAALTAATTLAMIPLLRFMLEPAQADIRKPRWLDYLGVAVLLLPMIIEGLVPFVVASLFGRQVEDASAFASDALFHAQNFLLPLVLLGAVLLPFPVALVIARSEREGRIHFGNLPRTITQVLDLSVLGRGLVLFLDLFGLTARQVSALIEQHPLGWVLFAAIWVALWLLNGQGGK